jgi:hypothetical protein
MSDKSPNLRRFFRNRFEVYSVGKDVTYPDGSALTLSQLCELLDDDEELFPRHYDNDVQRLFSSNSREALPCRLTYGAVANAIRRQIKFGKRA